MSEQQYGQMVVISGPSGVGKGTLIHRLMERREDLAFSVSYTTRQPRPGEQDGVDYCFVTPEEFETRVAAGDFLEHAGYADHAYGTSNSYVSRHRAEGKTVLLDIEVQGAMQVRENSPGVVLIYVMPPSYQVLKERLVGRGTETAEKICKRLAAAREESRFIDRYDYVIVNDDLNRATEELNGILNAIVCRPCEQVESISQYQCSFPQEGEPLL